MISWIELGKLEHRFTRDMDSDVYIYIFKD